MAVYRAYRDRVFAATHQPAEDAEFFGPPPIMRADDIAAVDALKLRADAGECEAQLRLGRFSDRGVCTSINCEKAAEYYRLAADQGDPTAIFNLAIYLSSGVLGEPDFAGAAALFRRAATEFRMPRASLHLAVLLAPGGEGVTRDLPGAVALLRPIADAPIKDPEAHYQLGCILRVGGYGVDPEPVGAKRYFELAHAQGVNAASNDLAAMSLEWRPGVPPNVAYAIDLYKQAASREHPRPMVCMGSRRTSCGRSRLINSQPSTITYRERSSMQRC
jgi:TPR repeat protein